MLGFDAEAYPSIQTPHRQVVIYLFTSYLPQKPQQKPKRSDINKNTTLLCC